MVYFKWFFKKYYFDSSLKFNLECPINYGKRNINNTIEQIQDPEHQTEYAIGAIALVLFPGCLYLLYKITSSYNEQLNSNNTNLDNNKSSGPEILNCYNNEHYMYLSDHHVEYPF